MYRCHGNCSPRRGIKGTDKTTPGAIDHGQLQRDRSPWTPERPLTTEALKDLDSETSQIHGGDNSRNSIPNGQVAELKEQLEGERDQVKHLQIALKEQLLAGTAHEEIPPRLETGYPFNDLQAVREKVEKLEPPLLLRPLVKTEYIYDDDQDQFPQVTTKEVPYTATEFAKLKKDFGQTLRELETEYMWRVLLSGRDQILLSEKEAERYWEPGVLLTTGNYHALWSLTQWAPYWVGGLNPLERGDPLAITGTVDQLVESAHKAACLQMMYDWKLEPRQESPMMMPVDPEPMTALMRGLPDSLKPIGIQLQGKIQAMLQSERVAAALEGLTPDRHCWSPDRKMWTWGEVSQELINYRHKYGPVNLPTTKTDPRGLRRAEVKMVPCPEGDGKTPLTKPPGGRDIPNKRSSLWAKGCQKGILCDLMDGLPTDKVEKLVSEWPDKLADKETGSKNTTLSAPSLIDLSETKSETKVPRYLAEN
ncbi:PREDICTED: LOW QUALITY PROTEIN: uncharacterized protein LOC104072469 [Fulmarus glacialis]|uniref:LOW QUALITY PROTEIN: uncharacterized protein LOC104072469 n=1 Tax=Fulmarus glacialis TaxID=30455 RepID=UPI00051B14C0|nr:PREDICTED: LOW QUALITY PROTEIN: uncharacterized protein LOC104072469 [Fulmarus glacialis]